MSTIHQFGGDWTNEKLERVRKYLQAYTTIFNANPRAQKLHTVYVDAFAGTGYRTSRDSLVQDVPLFEVVEEDNQAFLKGSARIALEVEPPFKEYVFIERDPEYARELNHLQAEFRSRRGRMTVIGQDANSYLLDWVKATDWRITRAVVFLDPYGMEVEWPVIRALGSTQAVDLWMLFPLGVAVNRLLTKSAPPPDAWARSLTRVFGTDEWRDVFYPRRKVLTLFGEEEVQQKKANFEKIGQFFLSRLKTAFTAVAPEPLALLNSKNNPLYLLCFASANPKGAPTAIKIASHILRN
ncbi:MAG: three-Cys-motif partner protein TcmP [Anaerolineales bacterium]|jgi:three-Cys-motif partner protein